MNSIKKIRLSGEKELRVFMLPLRQDILRLLQVHAKPMTAKQVADTLNITPSSAKHHLLKLCSIGLVEEDHTELIHGITARYYRRVTAEVSIGTEISSDPSHGKRVAVVRALVEKILDGFFRYVVLPEQKSVPEYDGDVYTGVAHLTPKEASELDALLTEFFAKHETPREGTLPYEYAIVAYPAKEAYCKEQQEDLEP